MRYSSIIPQPADQPGSPVSGGMNRHTKAVLEVLKSSIASMEVDSNELNDELNSALSSVDGEQVDLKDLRAHIVKELSKKALKTADELVGMVQQICNL